MIKRCALALGLAGLAFGVWCIATPTSPGESEAGKANRRAQGGGSGHEEPTVRTTKRRPASALRAVGGRNSSDTPAAEAVAQRSSRRTIKRDFEDPATVPALWRLDEESAYLFDHPIGDYRPRRHGLRLATPQIRSLAVGDDFRVPLPGVGEVEATVSWINEAENGDRGIGAIVDGDGDEYALTLTLGRHALFGQVSTAHGRFLVEGQGDLAAVFRDDLHEVLVDPRETDERIPPEDS